MRFTIIVKSSKDTEGDVMPSNELIDVTSKAEAIRWAKKIPLEEGESVGTARRRSSARQLAPAGCPPF